MAQVMSASAVAGVGRCRMKVQKIVNGINELKTGGRGFEPQLTESESVVLPLDDPPSLVNGEP